MNQELIDNNYIFIPKFLSPDFADALSTSFVNFCESQKIPGDEQASNSSSYYDFFPFLEVLTQSVPYVSQLIDEPVFPTYSYARVYRPGDDLKRHRDRPACEISLTVNLFQSKDWPIWIQKPNGESSSVSFNQGDAMMYLGCEADHWRDEINQDRVVQLFLHYVRARGPNNWAYFDKRR